MTVRGFVWAIYNSDDGNQYALRVDADYAAMPERGWTVPAPAGMPPYPRGWMIRKVVGLDSDGHPRKAGVGSITADLWTGVVKTFDINASDETVHTVTVDRMYSERWRQRPG